MGIDYFPLDPEKIHNFFESHNIKYDSNELLNLIDKKYCTYIDNDGLICGRRSRILIKDNFCKIHLKKKEKINNKDIKKKKRKKDLIYKCIGYSIRGNCKRNVKGPNMKCLYHENSKMLNFNFIKNNNSLLKSDNTNVLHSTRRKNKKNKLEKYRKINIIDYIYYNKINYKNDGIRKKIKYNNKYFTVNTENNLFIDENNNKVYGEGLLNFIIYLYDFNINKSIKYINKYIKKKEKTILFPSFPSGQMVHPSDIINKNSELLNFNKIKNNNLLLNKSYIPKINIKNLNNIKQYLINTRFIKKDIIEEYINKELIYSDNYNNIVFTNIEKTFSLSKGIGKKKYNKCSGKPDFIKYGNNTGIIYLFESPIDILSFIDIYNIIIKDEFISTNGDMMVNKVINYIKNNKIKKIYTCFDNDIKGNQFHDKICKDIENNKLNIIVERKIVIGYKDFNDYLIYIRKNNIII